MYCLEVITSPSFQAGKQIKDNHNRDSSFVRSRGSYVIHSGVHRETAFLIDDGIASFDYWSTQGQAAINGFIEATIADYSLEDCERNAISKRHPEWKFSTVKYRGNLFTATSGDKLQTRISALNWIELNEKLG